MYLHLIDSNGVFQTHNHSIMRHVVFHHSTSIAVHSSLISFIGESRKGKFDARLQQKFRFLPFLINVHPFVSFFFGAKNGESVFLLEKNSFRCEIFRKMLFRRKEKHNFFARARQQQPTLLVTATSDCCIEYQELRKWMELRRNCYF